MSSFEFFGFVTLMTKTLRALVSRAILTIVDSVPIVIGARHFSFQIACFSLQRMGLPALRGSSTQSGHRLGEAENKKNLYTKIK